MEKRKKRNLILGLGLFMFVISSIAINVSLISAQSVEYFIDRIIYGAEPLLQLLLGDNVYGELLFMKLVFFLLLLALVNVALSRVPMFKDNYKISSIIAFIVALVSTRYWSESVVNFVWVQYGVIGIFISSFLPFIIFFYFIEGLGSFLRKTGWIVYGSIFFVLAIYSWDDLSWGYEWYQNWAMVYVVIVLLSLICVIFDKAINARISLANIMKISDRNKRIMAIDIKKDIDDLRKRLTNSSLSSSDIRAIKSQIRSKKHQLMALYD
ncbi:MAG: hypothetical protein ACP5OG_01415 [Candidatus Nanoarchaeia archaeon]